MENRQELILATVECAWVVERTNHAPHELVGVPYCPVPVVRMYEREKRPVLETYRLADGLSWQVLFGSALGIVEDHLRERDERELQVLSTVPVDGLHRPRPNRVHATPCRTHCRRLVR